MMADKRNGFHAIMLTSRQTHANQKHYLEERRCVCSDESRLTRSVSYELDAEAKKANIIASQAANDSEAIVAASRRHDRDFMHDVATKLVLCLSTRVLYVLRCVRMITN